MACPPAVFDSPCGELLIHDPSFLAWFLGLSGRAKRRAGRRGGRRLGGLTEGAWGGIASSD
jgi:hypothetical protein